MDGIINIYKEKGFTSHDVVAKLRGIFKQKKIGHTGTLDPEAEGVLPVCLGKGTKLCDLLTEKDKQYEAILKLGVTTDTQDMTGTVLKESVVNFDEQIIREAILSFEGEYDQLPPMYSALKVNGKKLYELAREGKEVERTPRRIQIHKIEILDMNPEKQEVSIRIDCSKGTYIRTLCHDIGEKLGCGGAMAALLRTRVERFYLKDSIKLGEVEARMKEGTLSQYIIPVEQMFSQYERFQVKEEYDKLLLNGNPLTEKMGTEKNKQISQDKALLRVYDSQNKFMGLYEYSHEESRFKPYKMFL